MANQALRQTDKLSDGSFIISNTSPSVKINNLPAAMITSKTNKGGIILTGSTSVFINGKAAAIVSSKDNKGNKAIIGSTNVEVG